MTSKLLKEREGVIVGSTKNQEWILPWWWMNYSLHNSYPVTFFNFGDMSEKAIHWCLQRGNVINLEVSSDFVALKEDVDPEVAKLWEETSSSSIWKTRLEWFKKPFAISKSPYQRTVWMDSDCQTRGSIEPLFHLILNETGIALAAESKAVQNANLKRKFLFPDEIEYNGGVIVYDRSSEIVHEWVDKSLTESHLFFGDQQLLSRVLFTKSLVPTHIPPLYNWRVDTGISYDAFILHWAGSAKEHLRSHLEIFEKFLFVNLSLTSLEPHKKSPSSFPTT